MLLAVRKCHTIHPQHWVSDTSSVWVHLRFPGSLRPLFLDSCYLPLVNFPKLLEVSLDARTATLHNHISAASLLGDISLAGDFNARIGVHPVPHPPLTPLALGPEAVPEATVLARSLETIAGDTGAVLPILSIRKEADVANLSIQVDALTHELNRVSAELAVSDLKTRDPRIS